MDRSHNLSMKLLLKCFVVVFQMCVLTDSPMCVRACACVSLSVCIVSLMPGALLQTQHVDVFSLVTCQLSQDGPELHACP